MMLNLGFYNTSGTRTMVRFPFPTFASAGGNVAPSSAFENADIRIYKAADSADTSATQRSSSNGITMTSPFDSLTGFHNVAIDLTDNTDAGFYASGSAYFVVLAPDETVDGQTLTAVPLAFFEIGLLAVNVAQISGDSGAADNAETAFDGGSYNVGGGGTVAASVTAGVSLGVDAVNSSSVAASGAAEFADKVLGRNAKGGADGPAAESVAAAIAGGFMYMQVVAGVLTVKYADGTTAFTRTLSRTALDAITQAVP